LCASAPPRFLQSYPAESASIAPHLFQLDVYASWSEFDSFESEEICDPLPEPRSFAGFAIYVNLKLITRGGYNWTDRYPWIVEAALKNLQQHFVIDGEAVILGVDGYSDFNALHSGKHNEEVQLCAFDALAMDGDDLRGLPLSMRNQPRSAIGAAA